MRPLELRIKGLNSFRAEQSIDFKRLGEYSFFGIFGPTGSGKSSILDAIILALYGVVPRAGGGAAGIINQMEDNAEVGFRFELAGAEGRQEYLIQRRYRRDKNDTDSTRFISGRLTRVTGTEVEVLASKDSELKTTIVELLGLSAQDFTRAVVLPQGRFAEFLALKGRERTDMLERIFALEQFGEQLARNLKSRLESAASAMKILSSEMNGIGDASIAALEFARQVMEQARQEAAAAENEEKAARIDHEEQNRVWELQENLVEVQRAIDLLRVQSDKIEGLRQSLDRARRAEEVRPILAAAEVMEKDLQAAGNEMATAVGEEVQVRREAEENRLSLSQADKEWQEGAPLIRARLERLQEIIGLERESTEGKRLLSSWRTEIQNDEKTLQELRSRLEQLENMKKTGEARQERLTGEREQLRVEPELRESLSMALNQLTLLEMAQQTKTTAQQNLQDKQNEVVEQEKALGRASKEYEEQNHQVEENEQTAEKLRKELTGCLEPEDYVRYHSILEQFEQAQASWQLRKERLAEMQTSHETKYGEYQRLQEKSRELETQRSAIQEAIDNLTQKQRRETELNQAAHLAGLLEAGQPCPVCGSCEHPRPARTEEDCHSGLEEENAGHQAGLSTIEETLAGLNSKLGAAQAALDLQEGLQQESLTQLEEGSKAVAAWREKLPPAMRNLSLMVARQQLNEQKAEYEQKVAACREMELKIKGLERDRGLALAEKEKQTGILTHSLRLLAETTATLEQAAREENELGRVFAEKARSLDPQALREQERLIQGKDRRIRELDKTWQDLIDELQKISRDLEEVRLQAGRAEQDLALKQADVANKEQTLAKLEGQITALTAGKPVRAIMDDLELELQDMEKRLANCRRQAGQSDQQLETAVKRLSAAQTRAHDAAVRHKEAAGNLDAALTSCRFASAGEARYALAGKDELQGWEGSIKSYEEEVKRLARQQLALEDSLQGSAVSREQWEASGQRWQQAVMNTKDTLERKAVAQNQWQVLEQKNQRWLEIEQELRRWQEQNDRLQLLQSTLKGKDFVKFIAGEQLRYICQSASLRLQQLSRCRYGLELDSDNNFVIRDDHNGGLRRAVSTLSGGETFLASLALALALSAQIQLRGQYPLEFFFLDEGFGTLDPDLLDTVMNSLESLRHERFMVGVISHVPELRNRLPRHLQVIPPEPGGAGTELKLI